MARIYVASSWRNEYQQGVVRFLRGLGHEVYDFKNPHGGTGFSWSDVDPDWQNWTTPQYIEALAHPISQKGFDSDFNAMDWADVCVLVLPCNRSAHTEAGFMKGEKKLTLVYVPEPIEPELMYKVFDGVFFDLESLGDRIMNDLLEQLDVKAEVPAEPTYKLTDHAHYERNAPGYPQAVFFDVEPIFHHKISKAVSGELSKINEEEAFSDKVHDWGTILSRLAQTVERELGALTLPELLYAVHFISAQLAYTSGRNDGYDLAKAEAPKVKVSVKDIKSKRATA